MSASPRVEHVVQGLAHHGVVAADAEDPEPGQEVGVALAIGVVEVGTFRALVHAVEADGVQHPGQLGVQVLAGEGVALPVAGSEKLRQVENHVE